MFILISLLEVVIPRTVGNVSTSIVCSSTCSPIARLSCDITSSIISNVAWLFSSWLGEKSDWDVCGVLLPLWYGLTVTARTAFAATSLAFSAFTCGFSYIYTSWSYISCTINWYRCYVYRWLNWIIGSWPQHSFNKKQKKYSPDTFPHGVVVVSYHSWKIFGGSIYIWCSSCVSLGHKADRILLCGTSGFPYYDIVYRTVHICTLRFRHEKTEMIKKHTYTSMCLC